MKEKGYLKLGCVRIRQYKTWQEMPSWLLVVIGGLQGLAAAEFALITGEGALGWRNAFNQTGYVPLAGYILGMLLLASGTFAWLTGAVALRCSEILRSRFVG